MPPPIIPMEFMGVCNNDSVKISTIIRIRVFIILVLIRMNSVTTYYRTRAKEYRRNLRSALRSPSIETIHNLRLVIKKMRALYHIAASHDPHFDFDLHFGSFIKIFKAAGKLRDIDITHKCLSEILPY